MAVDLICTSCLKGLQQLPVQERHLLLNYSYITFFIPRPLTPKLSKNSCIMIKLAEKFRTFWFGQE